MRVLVCGGRHYEGDRAWNAVMGTLDALHWATPITAIIQGGATGADALARSWATMRGIKCITVPALWAEHGRAAGPIRNQRMIDDFHPDYVVAFLGGRGTADMMSRARASSIPVEEYTEVQKHCADSAPEGSNNG